MDTQHSSSGMREWNPGGKRGSYRRLVPLLGAVAVVGAAMWVMFNPHAPASDQPPPAKLASEDAAAQAGPAAADAQDNQAAQPGSAPAPQAQSPSQASQQQQSAAYTPTAPTTDQAAASTPADASAPATPGGGGNAQVQAAQNATAAPEPAPATAASAQQPAAAAAPDQAVAAADASAPSAPPAAKPKARHHAAAAKEKAGQTQLASAAPVPPVPAASDALRQWWATGGDASSFKVKAVGQGGDGASVVLVFSHPVDPSAAAQHLRLLNEQGSPVSGTWQPGGNPYVLALPGIQTGRYMLFIDQAIASTDGQSLGADVQGPVYVSPRAAQAASG
jgi:hypothetical protein